ncbi:MAG: dUTP pyrophosphatase [Thermodesulfobacteriota bacterium]|nr:dUTP pyrophosphatase [Thermodesulfobacteriota bacterium]
MVNLSVNEVEIDIVRLPGCDDLPLPRYMTEHSAGMDICAAVDREITIPPGQREVIPTGMVIALPAGYEAQIRPRSGLALKHGITLVNSPGTIDADYRGEIRLLMINHGKNSFVVRRGDRVAQMVINQVCRGHWRRKEALDETARGQGGFGHT